MTVLIDMEIPNSCYGCRMAHRAALDMFCYAMEFHKFIAYGDQEKRPSWCPLKEVK